MQIHTTTPKILLMAIVLSAIVGALASKTLEVAMKPAHAGPEENAELLKQSQTFRKAAKRIGPSVVNIVTLHTVRVAEFDPFYGIFYRNRKYREDQRVRGIGSGFVFDSKNGYILTNNHVIEGGEAWVVQLPDKTQLNATVVGSDPRSDVAVLKVNSSALIAAELGDSDLVSVGDWVLACGNPFGMLEQSVTAGIVSAKGRHGLGVTDYEDFLQTDAAINQGNSGGPLVNLEGQVVGVNTAIFSKSGGNQGIGFAIPINQARKIAEILVTKGSVNRGFIGATFSEHEKLKNMGLFIKEMQFKGPAHLAGVQVGDILIAIDGKPIRSGLDLQNKIVDYEPGQQLKLTLIRDRQKIELSVTLGPAPRMDR